MLLIEFHSWKGVGRDRDLFWLHVRAGFVTLAANKVSIVDTLRTLKAVATRMKGGPQ